MYKFLNIGIWLSLAVLYLPVFKILYSSRWQAVDYTHAYFILPVSLYLVWCRRRDIKKNLNYAAPGREYLYTGLFLFGIACFIFSMRWDYLVIATFSLVPAIYGLVGMLYGKNVLSLVRFPVLYLLLLVPPPLGIVDNLTLPMRRMISAAVGLFLKLMNYPVSREGLLLSIGKHDVFVGQPCSGFRSLVTVFALAILYIYLSKGKWAKKAILLASVVPLAFFGNFIRITILCLVTYHLGEEAAQGFFHNFSGMVIFIIIILGLLGLETFLDKKYFKTYED